MSEVTLGQTSVADMVGGVVDILIFDAADVFSKHDNDDFCRWTIGRLVNVVCQPNVLPFSRLDFYIDLTTSVNFHT